MRTISDNGIKFVAAWEKFAGTAYRATPAEKYLTIGFGHYGADVKPGQQITEGQAYLLLNRDLQWAKEAVDAAAHPSLNQAQFDAVVDLVFNVGAGAIAPQTGTGKALRAGDVDTLRQKVGAFIYQKGKVMLGLRRRCAGRVALFEGKTAAEAEAIGRAVK